MSRRIKQNNDVKRGQPTIHVSVTRGQNLCGITDKWTNGGSWEQKYLIDPSLALRCEVCIAMLEEQGELKPVLLMKETHQVDNPPAHTQKKIVLSNRIVLRDALKER